MIYVGLILFKNTYNCIYKFMFLFKDIKRLKKEYYYFYILNNQFIRI